MLVDYQVVVDIVVQLLSVSVPIGLVFGLTKKMVTFFFSLAFGERQVKL